MMADACDFSTNLQYFPLARKEMSPSLALSMGAIATMSPENSPRISHGPTIAAICPMEKRTGHGACHVQAVQVEKGKEVPQRQSFLLDFNLNI
jgi:hypothetical protein